MYPVAGFVRLGLKTNGHDVTTNIADATADRDGLAAQFGTKFLLDRSEMA